MANPSVYKHLRPLMILCYLMGQFAVVCVTVERSDLLHYHRLSKSLISLFLHVGAYWIVQMWKFIAGNVASLIVNVRFLYCVVLSIKMSSMLVWFYLGSKNIVQAFHAVDSMRETLTLIPLHTRLRFSTLRAHSWYIVTIFMFLLTVELAVSFALMREHSIICSLFVVMIAGNAVVVQTVTLISLIYSCSLVIEDSIRVWIRHRTKSFAPLKNITPFCQMILTQLVILNDLNRTLGKHTLVILVVRIIELLDVALLLAQVVYAEAMYVNDLAWWSSCLGFLFFSVDDISSKMDRLLRELLNSELALHGVSKREAAKVKMFMSLLQTRSTFSAAGFVELTPEIFLSFLSLGIDFLILLWQNKTFMRNVLGMKTLGL